jgi:hypothetical protein
VYANALELNADHFVFVRGGHSLDAENVRSELEQSIAQVQQIADRVNHDVRQWVGDPTARLNEAARDRLNRVDRGSALDQALGLPISSTAPEKQFRFR